jgi:putative membrane protein insertion efficiency factor
MLRFYKSAISPLLAPACRFQPTCSAYAMDAYKRHGVARGTVLTAWRLMRCTPFGGFGYDPVQWPPPGFRAGSGSQR